MLSNRDIKFMKKILLVTASIFAIASSCYADTTDKTMKNEGVGKGDKAIIEERGGMPQFDISGSASFFGSSTNPDITYYGGKNITTEQKSNAKTNKDTSATRFVGGDAEIVFAAKGDLVNGWIYGAKLTLDAMKDDTGIDKMYLIFEKNNIGTFHAGNVKGPESTFLASGQNLIGGTCGIDGTVTHDLDYATGVISGISMVGVSGKSTKVVYYSPKIYGLQFGISLAPDTKHLGHNDKDWHSGDASNGNDYGLFSKGDKDKQRPSGRNNIGLGLKHENDFGNGWKTKVSGVMVMEDTKAVDTYFGNTDSTYKETTSYTNKELTEGKSTTYTSQPATPVATKIKLRNAHAYHLTGTVTYKDWSLGAGYLNNGKSRLPVASTYTSDKELAVLPGGFIAAKDSNAGHAWNIGARYNYNKWSFAGVYHRTDRKVTGNEKATGNMFTFTTDYLVCPGLKMFVEIDHVITRSSDYACYVYNSVRDSKTAIKKQNTTLFAIGAKISF